MHAEFTQLSQLDLLYSALKRFRRSCSKTVKYECSLVVMGKILWLDWERIKINKKYVYGIFLFTFLFSFSNSEISASAWLLKVVVKKLDQ